MNIKDYPEKEIRKKTIEKLKPKISNTRSKHDKGLIFIEGKKVITVKLPNEHKRIMKRSKSKYIAMNLLLTPDEFNKLIDCDLKGPEYLKKLASQIK